MRRRKRREAKVQLSAVPSARPRTVPASVSHPTVPGLSEQVERVFDTLDHMRQAGQLSPATARGRRDLPHCLPDRRSFIGGVMDFDRIRAGVPSTTPHLAELIAADLLREAQRILYHRDYPIVVAVVGHGQTLREVAGGTFALAARLQWPASGCARGWTSSPSIGCRAATAARAHGATTPGRMFRVCPK